MQVVIISMYIKNDRLETLTFTFVPQKYLVLLLLFLPIGINDLNGKRSPRKQLNQPADGVAIAAILAVFTFKTHVN